MAWEYSSATLTLFIFISRGRWRSCSLFLPFPGFMKLSPKMFPEDAPLMIYRCPISAAFNFARSKSSRWKRDEPISAAFEFKMQPIESRTRRGNFP